MTRREEFHEKLCLALGSRYVYYQPPASISLTYPCIVYERNNISQKYANNLMYNGTRQYSVKLIDPSPDSSVIDNLLSFPLCRYVRHYASDNLNHDIFYIYY